MSRLRTFIASLIHRPDPVPAWKKAHPTWPFDRTEQGRKAAATCKTRYGLNYHEQIGRRGGRIARRTLTHEQAVALAALAVAARRRKAKVQA